MSDTKPSSPAVAATEPQPSTPAPAVEPTPSVVVANAPATTTKATTEKRPPRANRPKRPTEEWIQVKKKARKPAPAPLSTTPPAATKNTNNKKQRNKNNNNLPVTELLPTAGGAPSEKSKPRRGGRASGVLTPEEEELKKRFLAEEEELKKKCIFTDDVPFNLVHQSSPPQENLEREKKVTWSKVLFPRSGNEEAKQPLTRIAGVHVEFPLGNRSRSVEETIVVIGIVVVSIPELNILYSDASEKKLDQPQVHGIPSFREVSHIVELIKSIPGEFAPQLIVVNGHGVLHQRGFGLAGQLGVAADIPTIGVSKKFVPIDSLTDSNTRDLCKKQTSLRHEAVEINSPLTGKSLAAAMRTGSSELVYISIGHRVSLGTAIEIIREVCPKSFPLPLEEAALKAKEKSGHIDSSALKPQAGFGKTGRGRRQGGRRAHGEARAEQGATEANGGLPNSKPRRERFTRQQGDGNSQGPRKDAKEGARAGQGGRQGGRQRGNRGEGRGNAAKDGQNPKQQGVERKPGFPPRGAQQGTQSQQAQPQASQGTANGRPNQRRPQGGKKTGAQKTNVWQRIQPATVPAPSQLAPQQQPQEPASQQSTQGNRGASRQGDRKGRQPKQVLQPKKTQPASTTTPATQSDSASGAPETKN